MLSGIPSGTLSFFSTLGGILSGPCALSLFNLFSSLVTASGVTLNSDTKTRFLVACHERFPE